MHRQQITQKYLSIRAYNATKAMKKIFDGKHQVKQITVLALFRDDADYLRWYVDMIRQIEDNYDVVFSYYFLENNSKDETPSILKSFLETRAGKLIIVDLSKDYVQDQLSINLERIHTLAALRNRLLAAVQPLQSEWTWIIDSGIYFPLNILENMFRYDPTENKIVMMSPYTSQLYPSEMFKHLPPTHPITQHIQKTNVSALCLSHWFDTFSFIDSEGINHYPSCAFEKCNMCRNNRKHNYTLIAPDADVVDVRSAFGGFCLIKSSVLNAPGVKWDTICLDVTTHRSVCEHVLFCDRVRTISNQRTVVLQNIANVHRRH